MNQSRGVWDFTELQVVFNSWICSVNESVLERQLVSCMIMWNNTHWSAIWCEMTEKDENAVTPADHK